MKHTFRLGAALVAVIALGWIDYLTGPEYGFSLFYLIPILVIGWLEGAAAGALVGVVASVAWFCADYLWARTSVAATLWNSFTRLTIYVSMGVVTARLRADRKRLQKSNEELEAFTYSVSHDLRAPLVHISGFATKLSRHVTGRVDAEVDRHVETIRDSASVGLKLIDDLLEFSHLGRRDVQRKAVDLNELVAAVREELLPTLGGRDVTWVVHPLPVVTGDPSMLRIVMQNLIANALKYTSRRDHARVEIGAREERGEHLIFIRDNGVGFNPAYTSKLFRVFERLHDRTEFEGNGIGLAIAHRVVSRHQGRIWAEGEVEQGATFYVTLPTSR